MRQLFESQLEKVQPDFFKFEVLNSKWRRLVAAVTVENGGTWWEKAFKRRNLASTRLGKDVIKGYLGMK